LLAFCPVEAAGVYDAHLLQHRRLAALSGTCRASVSELAEGSMGVGPYRAAAA
jgi:hypothetical protein